jgi:hypothetical protein
MKEVSGKCVLQFGDLLNLEIGAASERNTEQDSEIRSEISQKSGVKLAKSVVSISRPALS